MVDLSIEGQVPKVEDSSFEAKQIEDGWSADRMKEISPEELLSGSTRPASLRLESVHASELSKRFSLKLYGPDLQIRSIEKLSTASGPCAEFSTSFFSSAKFAHLLKGIRNCAIITKPELGEMVVESGNSALISNDPKSTFFEILLQFVSEGRYEALKNHRDASAKVADTAYIGGNVYIDRDAWIGDGAKILPNSYIGVGAIVHPKAVVGHSGFEPVEICGRRRLSPHAGGVWLAAGVTIGANSCIDKGYFGEFTFIGEETSIGPFVHVAHSVKTGMNCDVGSGVQIAGFASIGDGVQIGPHATVLQITSIGEYSLIGSGSVVLRDIPAFRAICGSPSEETSKRKQACAQRA